MYKKILLPTDGSEYSASEAKRATKLLADDGEVIILSVATELRKTAFHRKGVVDEVNQAAIEEAEEDVKRMKALFDDSVNVMTKVVVGFPAESINQVAEEEGADLIIIASSGKSGLHKFVIGSVAEKVLKNSEIDVLLVHD